MKNVLVDLHRLKYNPYNGLYRFCMELGGAMARQQQADLHLHYYVPEKDYGVFGSDVSYVAHRSIDKFYRFGTSRFDVWHATTTLSWYRPFNRRTKFVFTIHDLNFLEEAERSQAQKERSLRLIQQRVDRADFITYISEHSKQEALKFLKLADKPGRVIYNGCNAPPPGMTFQRPAGIPDMPFLFSLGLFMSRKNFHVLPALLKHTDYHLVIAGINDMPYKDEVIRCAQEHGVLERLHLTGPVSENEKFWLYQNSAAFLFPSLGEGFGLPIIEAMWFGKPVFISHATCLPEIGGTAAYYFNSFEPEDMRQVFKNGMEDYRMHNRAESIRERAAVFSWPKTAQAYLDVYHQL